MRVLSKIHNVLSGFTGRLRRGSEPFILTAMLSLVGGCAWLFRERELLLGHFYRPEFLSITHTITLGWVSMLMMGVLVRLCPRMLGVSIRSPRWLLAQFLCMFVGYTGMTFHFWISGWVAMASAALLIVLAGAIQIYNLAGVFTRLRSMDWLPWYVGGAMIHFLLAAILGVTLGFNKRFDLVGGEFFPNIFAHAHLAGLGWVTMMILGFEHRLLPTSAPRPGSLWPGFRFWLLEIGLIGMVMSLLATPRGLPLFAALAACAIVLHARRPLWMLIRRRIQDRASLWATMGLLFLIVNTLVGVLLSLDFPSPTSPLRTRVQFAYGYLALFGWMTLTITSMVYKLFPMFVWEERFRELWGKGPVPAMRDLYSKRLQTLSGSFLALGVLGTSVGIVTTSLPLITLSHGIVILGVAAFIMNFSLIARWALLQKTFLPEQGDWERFRRNFRASPSERISDPPES